MFDLMSRIIRLLSVRGSDFDLLWNHIWLLLIFFFSDCFAPVFFQIFLWIFGWMSFVTSDMYESEIGLAKRCENKGPISTQQQTTWQKYTSLCMITFFSSFFFSSFWCFFVFSFVLFLISLFSSMCLENFLHRTQTHKRIEHQQKCYAWSRKTERRTKKNMRDVTTTTMSPWWDI